MKKKIVKPLPQKEVKKKQNEVMAWILAVMMILWTVASVLGVIGFARTCHNEEESGGIVRASAETAVDISTADTFMQTKPISRLFDSENSSYSFDMDILNSMTWTSMRDTVSTYNTIFTFNAGYNQRYIKYDDVVISLVDSNSSTSIEVLNLYDGDTIADDIYIYALSGPYGTPNAVPINSFPRTEEFYPYAYSIDYVDYDVALGGAVLQVTMQEKSILTGNIFQYYIIIDTYDIDTINSIYITSRNFDVLSSTSSPFYIIDGLDFSYATINDQAYTNGYNAGESAGYQRGYNYGYDIGKADGFSQGVADANEYSFAGFLGAIFDVPVQTFLSITNFEILGVNLGGFLLALLTILMILAVLKLIF